MDAALSGCAVGNPKMEVRKGARRPKASSVGSGKTCVYYPVLILYLETAGTRGKHRARGVLLLLAKRPTEENHASSMIYRHQKSSVFLQGRPQRTAGWQHRHPQCFSSGWPQPGYAKPPHNYSCKNLCFHIPCHPGVERAKFIKFVPKTEEVHS